MLSKNKDKKNYVLTKYGNVMNPLCSHMYFAAGTDTAYATLECAMTELINHPCEMCKLQKEVRKAVGAAGHVTNGHLDKMRYFKAVIKERRLLHMPVPLLVPRETLEDTELLGYHVPARTRVLINAWAISRDASTRHERAVRVGDAA